MLESRPFRILRATTAPIDLLRYRIGDERPLPIFIVGCGNSGTSLLRVILGHHADVHAHTLETSFALGGPDPAVASAISILERRPFRRARELSDEAQMANRTFWLEKTPRHVHSIRYLLALDNRAHVICMVRAPLDVVASFIRRGYDFDRALTRWIEDNQAALVWLERSNRVTGLSYENLVEAPADVIRRLCERLGLAYGDYLLDFASSSQSLEPPENARSEAMARHWRHRAKQLNQPISGQSETWSETLSDEQAETVRRSSGPLYREILDQLEYLKDRDRA